MADSTPLKTPLHDWHVAHGGRMVDFAGWSMPVQYSGIVQEHQAVRNGVGLFDVSHMGRLAFDGPKAVDWIDTVATNNASALEPGKIQYSLLANDLGGLIDDILVYQRPDKAYYVVCNASNRETVIRQFAEHQESFKASLADRTLETAMIAVQGPSAQATLQPLVDKPLDGLKFYRVMNAKAAGVDALVSRTGYTGEDGFEVIVPAANAEAVWAALMESGAPFGVAPIGLGARDTLRFEAGMPLYGHELTDTIDPFAAGVGWAVKLDKGDFVGAEALRQQAKNPGSKRVGLRLEGKRIARQGSTVTSGDRTLGAVTSGTFAPTLQQSLAMALIDTDFAAPGTKVVVDVRGKSEPAEVVPLPFYKRPRA
ncbi:glycine cleavage system aminomethyltransferase GcvT [Paludisphaera sp.]|uniref:glycine cleavage system aminomethyltransferase GcvT n=1 Tax=Paludisphaera sp. TaxID=2017432 RepID=UPI00301D0811